MTSRLTLTVERPRNRLGVSVLGLIPARGGSKRLPRKNILPLCGKPLIAWTIETAKKSTLITQLICSTEDDEIGEVCHRYGCDVLQRPAELATDEALSLDVVRHAVRAFPGYDYVCLLQPTSPLRRADDIDRCLGYCVPNDGTPVWTVRLGAQGYEPNGAVYCYPVRNMGGVWRNVGMPSDRCLDIDTEEDFLEAERIIRARG